MLCLTLCDPMNCSTPGSSVLCYFLVFAQIHVHWVSDAIQPSHPLLSASPAALSLSQHQGLSQWLSSHIWWPEYWSFSFSISPSNEYSGLFSFRIDWFDLLTVQWTLRSLLQHHSLKNELFSAQPFLWFNSHICTWLCKKHSFDYMDPCWQSNISAF